jgi:tetratricopeptide (TPR) repeat protein
LAKEPAGSRRRPGLVALLFFGLLFCPPAWGQDNSPPPGSVAAAERQAGGSAANGELALKPWADIRRYPARPLYTRPAALLLFLPGPLFFGVVLLLPRIRRRGLPLLMLFLLLGSRAGPPDPGLVARSAEEAFARGDLRRAAELYGGLEAKYPGNPALLYNLAVCRHLLGERGAAIYLLRRGLDREPGDSEIRAALVSLEKQYGLSGQLPLPPPLGAGLPFVLAACLSNLGFAAGAFFYRRRRVQLLILLVLLAAFTLVSAGLHLALESRENRVQGVVAAKTAELKMIPRERANNRLRLPEGTSLYVLGEDHGFLLVETGFGFKGWVEKKVLLID